MFINIENNKKIAQEARIVLGRQFLLGLAIKIPRRSQALVHLPVPLLITFMQMQGHCCKTQVAGPALSLCELNQEGKKARSLSRLSFFAAPHCVSLTDYRSGQRSDQGDSFVGSVLVLYSQL